VPIPPPAVPEHSFPAPYLCPSPLSQPTRGRAEGGEDDLLRACQDFEAVFLALLIAQMRRTVPEGGVLPRTTANDILQAQLDAEMCRNMSRKGSLGLAALLYRALSQPSRQEV
jgi:flagellar protein FlgJ